MPEAEPGPSQAHASPGHRCPHSQETPRGRHSSSSLRSLARTDIPKGAWTPARPGQPGLGPDSSRELHRCAHVTHGTPAPPPQPPCPLPFPCFRAPQSLCPGPALQTAQDPSWLHPPSCLPAALHPLCSPKLCLCFPASPPCLSQPLQPPCTPPCSQVCGALLCAGQACPRLLREPPKLPALLSSAAVGQVYPTPHRPGPASEKREQAPAGPPAHSP